jgi:hypothetical protein
LNEAITVQRVNLAGYTKRLSENTKTIQANNKKISETTRLMKLEDMTMSQLKNGLQICGINLIILQKPHLRKHTLNLKKSLSLSTTA